MLIGLITIGLIIVYCVWAYKIREGLHKDIVKHPDVSDFHPLHQSNSVNMSYKGQPVLGNPSYPISFLAPNVAQYGRRIQVIHPSTLTREVLFPANYAEMHGSSSPLAANPEAPPQLESDGLYIEPGSHKCPTCKSPFKQNYKCRPSLSGLFQDCGPYGLNVGRYGDQLTGCNCPLPKK